MHGQQNIKTACSC